jgi:hypothetical protein
MHPDTPCRARRRPSVRGAGALSGLLALTLLAGGCGSSAINSAAEQSAQAACLAASGNIKDQAAKQAADQACHAVGSGKTSQLTDAAIKAARLACLQASQQIPDPSVRNAAKAACPAGK